MNAFSNSFLVQLPVRARRSAFLLPPLLLSSHVRERNSQLVIKNTPPFANNLLTALGYSAPILTPSRSSSLKQTASYVPLSITHPQPPSLSVTPSIRSLLRISPTMKRMEEAAGEETERVEAIDWARAMDGVE